MKLFIKQDLQWFLFKLGRTIETIFILPGREFETKLPNTHDRISIDKNVKIRMRDGVNLFSDIYKPDAAGKYPVILYRMPYGKGEYYCHMPMYGRYWARKGFVCVVQDVRGKWASEGKWEPFVNEAQDGLDTLDWIATQPWCDGNIGMNGESYYGYTQWAVAPLKHPNLKCIAPGDTATDIYGVWFYVDHAFCQQTMGDWAIAMENRRYQNHLRVNHRQWPLRKVAEEARLVPTDYVEYLQHPERDSFWERINVDQKYADIHIPTLVWGGWYDVFLKGTINDWLGLRANAVNDQVRDNIWLLIGPIDHEQSTQETGRIGKVDVGDKAWSLDLFLPFFNYYLKGIDNGFLNEPRVKIFTIGENRWRKETSWPPKQMQLVSYFFHSQGDAGTGDALLDTDPPANEPPDQYLYDPDKPVDLTSKTDLWYMAQYLKDRRDLVKRLDVLKYATSEIKNDTELTGPLSVILYAASSACDTDFTATLVDVFPDGYAHLIQEGIVRARYRNGSVTPSNITPGKIYEYIIDLWATSYVVKKGHRLRVEISSSNFDRYDRNPNTGEPLGLSLKPVVAKQTIYHNDVYPSHVVLPLIPR
jgi:putative CocE/NonD family hydrolase